MIVLGAPVAERAWILPRWWECLSRQTLQPDKFCFVFTPSVDHTEYLLAWPGMNQSYVQPTSLPFFSRDIRNNDQGDPWRARHMAALRNQLRELALTALTADTDIFISLDTDILLEDETALERLVGTLDKEWDAVAALTYLNPLGARSECYNAGYLGGGSGFDQVWGRATREDFGQGPLVQIDIPMAVFAIKRLALGMCQYKAHECGEDIGFGQDLKDYGFKVGWRTDIEVRHVWNETWLGEEA